MAEQGQSGDSSFAKVFIPGLVVGLIVGMAIGVFVPTWLEKAPAPQAGSNSHSNMPRDGGRDQMPTVAPVTPTVPETKPVDAANPAPSRPVDPAKPTPGATLPK